MSESGEKSVVDRYAGVMLAAVILGVMGWVGLSLQKLNTDVPVMQSQMKVIGDDVRDLKRNVRDLERGPYRGDRR